MIYKKNKFKIYEVQYQKLILCAVIAIYLIGLFAGAYFTVKNGSNLSFVQKVTVTENLLNVEKTGDFGLIAKYLFRDIMLMSSILLLKYSGALKGMCISIPFIFAVQNSCIYVSIIRNNRISLYNLILCYITKDTAISMLIIIYTSLIIKEIISNKSDLKKDLKTLICYNSALFIIYIINISIINMFLQ